LRQSAILGKQHLDKIPEIEKLKHCFECGICTASCPVVELIPEHYHPRSLLERLSRDPNEVSKEASPWLCAWCYRCYRRCPQELKIPEILLILRDLATKQGNLKGFRKALETIQAKIPLPAVSCWVCFHHDRGTADKSEVVKALEAFVEDYRTKGKLPKAIGRPRAKVAIIGSGPAGLTAATELVQKGYSITIFESSSKLGGMLRKCMPRYRLPEAAIDAEIEHLTNLGVQIRTNVTIGRDLTIDHLRQEGFKAVFIATGAHEERKLNIEGANLMGVNNALEFLWNVNLEKRLRLGNRVAVVGGGNVAIDAARTALRLGAKEVSILYRRSREEMPANPWDIKEAEEEGVKFDFLVAPNRMLGKDGRVVAIECMRMELGGLDESGRRHPIPVEDSKFQKELDTVILAIGETPDLSFLPEEIQITENNTIAVDPFTLQTNIPDVFAGGDVVLGPATVIEAIVAGKRAAVSIDRYLQGRAIKTDEKVPLAEEMPVR
jgi:NADPH-dependent glutamate synthase beta subunit-like oxidoreductase